MQRVSILVAALVIAACHPPEDPPPPTEADELGVGADCAVDEDCNPDDLDGDGDGAQDQQCLTSFKGGYCGLRDCAGDVDCPQGSACVAHSDGVNYCFRICANKSECNYNRAPDNESNCSSNITFVDGGGPKACVPPSG